jgi:hypothetical protein
MCNEGFPVPQSPGIFLDVFSLIMGMFASLYPHWDPRPVTPIVRPAAAAAALPPPSPPPAEGAAEGAADAGDGGEGGEGEDQAAQPVRRLQQRA